MRIMVFSSKNSIVEPDQEAFAWIRICKKCIYCESPVSDFHMGIPELPGHAKKPIFPNTRLVRSDTLKLDTQ